MYVAERVEKVASEEIHKQLSHETFMTPLGYCEYDVMSQPISAAVESAVDAYATKLLRMKSPPEACIDDSLGPYVTSMLRCSMGPENENVRELEEFDSLMELLEEHCSLSADDALSSLSIIATAVRTGVMEVPVDPVMKIAVLEDIGSTLDDEPQFMFSKEEDIVSFNPQASDNYDSVTAKTPLPALEGNPLRSPDKFIPVDLMGVLDDPSTPTAAKNKDFGSPDPEPEAFPPLGSTPPPATKKSSKPPRNSTSEQGKDLAASLFRPPRSRQQSIDETDGCASSASQSSPPIPSADIVYHTFPVNNDNQYFHQQHLNSAIDMLLSMNPDLSEEAAQEAAVLANADINVAQYVIDGAMSAPPVCRHMLSDGCYRSDCQFSHDVVGHTCLFWIRGRCGKGGSCRFRHGFSETLLAGINLETASEKQEEVYTSSSVPMPIATKNLVSHNKEVGAPMANSWSSAGGGLSLGGYSLHSQGQQSSAGWEDYGVVARSLDKQTSNTFSFASIATKGYKSESFASGGVTQAMEEKPKFVRIPQDLWNPHINRDATAFHIQDPLDRYAVVSKAVARDDTIDLHFQSTSSFAVVLSRILPQKLRVHDEVWVVTGSGHHVARDSHQKGGGVLESAVLKWMEAEGYSVVRGRDRNGHSGAVLVRYGR